MSEWDRFYNKSNGHFAVRKLFFENNVPEGRKKIPPMFTLKPHEHKGLPSAYEIYMNSADEYEAALQLVPNMAVWDELCNTKWFMDGLPNSAFHGLKEWRKHMKARDASTAKAVLLEKTRGGDTTAAKAILAETKTKAPVGRKTKKTKAESATLTRIDNFRKKA